MQWLTAAEVGRQEFRQQQRPPPEQRCVQLWNAEANAPEHGVLRNEGGQKPEPVCLSRVLSGLPDLCLITANPDLGFAVQFLESSQDSGYSGNYKLTGLISSTNLDPSLTNWNASADAQGLITLK